MTPPINIDGTNENYSNVTIDGQDVEQITIDGQDVLSAIPDSVVDNFEDELYGSNGTISDFYGGDTGKHSRVDESNVDVSAQGGSKLVEVTVDGRNKISSTSGLNTYPSAGDNFRAFLRVETIDAQSGIQFFTQSETSDPDGYIALIEGNQNDIRIDKVSSGSLSILGQSGLSFSSSTESSTGGSWFDLEVRTDTNGNIVAELFDLNGNSLGSVSVSDSAFTSGGVGFIWNTGGGGSTTGYADQYRLV